MNSNTVEMNMAMTTNTTPARSRDGIGASRYTEASPWPARWRPDWARAPWPAWCSPLAPETARRASP
ncbi:hypothetical protein [Variovorax sp. OV329]|uniref:hypothetical protein n=1 Tax=Variovorax sp. OV329 TaxID=1882825 RepID=UPI0008F1E5EE|nr:hypothetical protein [Variovorax sp. OV329]SFL87440.1 hypothetical protein SAMN05444747_10175 [Variovorax sp. OV329]